MYVYNMFSMVKDLRIIELSCLFAVSLAAICQPPDKPQGGSYTPVSRRYLPGDKVTYFCHEGFVLSGKESRTCQFNGIWADKVPFCDQPIRLKGAVASSSFLPTVGSHRIIDQDLDTCFGTKPRAGEYFRVFMSKPATIYLVRIYMPKGEVSFSVNAERYRNMTRCSIEYKQLADKQWMDIHCSHSSPSDAVYIQDISSKPKTFEICEIEVFVKDTLFCEEPPDIFILNGWLEEVSREKAALRCAEGFRPGSNERLVCNSAGQWTGGILHCEEILCQWPSGNLSSAEWHSVGNENKLSAGSLKKLRCEHGYTMTGNPNTIRCLPNGTWTKSSARCEEKSLPPSGHEQKYNGIIISAAVVISIIFLTCFVVIVVLVVRKKSKPVVVFVKQGENIYSSIGGSQTDYSTISYGSGTSRSATNKMARPKDRPNLETFNEYAEPVDNYPPTYNCSSNYADPLEEVGAYANQNHNFSTLKDSPIYSNS